MCRRFGYIIYNWRNRKIHPGDWDIKDLNKIQYPANDSLVKAGIGYNKRNVVFGTGTT